jgi:hypothetical protein
MAEVRWTCHLCPAEFIFNGFDEAADHLATHGIQVDRWPDGSAVVIDTTLEPNEFTGGTP